MRKLKHQNLLIEKYLEVFMLSFNASFVFRDSNFGFHKVSTPPEYFTP